MDYRIIVLDLDGTLTNRDKVITPRTRQALMEAQERGKTVILASGRPTYGVVPLAKELKLEQYGGYILSFNGGIIMNCRTEKRCSAAGCRWGQLHHCRPGAAARRQYPDV